MISILRRGSGWAARDEATKIIVYSHSPNAARRRLYKAMEVYWLMRFRRGARKAASR